METGTGAADAAAQKTAPVRTEAVPRALFVPVSGPSGMGEFARARGLADALRARWPQVDIYVYAADHGFCNSDRPEKFDETACKKASARTLDFFRKHLG